jgi:hypothetical protein
LSERHCFQVTTPVTSRIDSPVSAAATALIPYAPPKTQSATVRPSAPAVIFSSVDIGPSLASSSRALAGASGVSLTSGGYSTYISAGVATSAVRPGAAPATAHWPHEIVVPSASAARLTASGLAAIAVMNMEEEMQVQRKQVIIRYAPIFASVPLAGSEPHARQSA